MDRDMLGKKICASLRKRIKVDHIVTQTCEPMAMYQTPSVCFSNNNKFGHSVPLAGHDVAA